jgi:hypothetical protein
VDGVKMESVTEQKQKTETIVLNILDRTAQTKYKNAVKKANSLKEFMNTDILVLNKDVSVKPQHKILSDLKAIESTIKNDDFLKAVFVNSRLGTTKALYKEYVKQSVTTN